MTGEIRRQGEFIFEDNYETPEESQLGFLIQQIEHQRKLIDEFGLLDKADEYQGYGEVVEIYTEKRNSSLLALSDLAAGFQAKSESTTGEVTLALRALATEGYTKAYNLGEDDISYDFSLDNIRSAWLLDPTDRMVKEQYLKEAAKYAADLNSYLEFDDANSLICAEIELIEAMSPEGLQEITPQEKRLLNELDIASIGSGNQEAIVSLRARIETSPYRIPDEDRQLRRTAKLLSSGEFVELIDQRIDLPDHKGECYEQSDIAIASIANLNTYIEIGNEADIAVALSTVERVMKQQPELATDLLFSYDSTEIWLSPLNEKLFSIIVETDPSLEAELAWDRAYNLHMADNPSSLDKAKNAINRAAEIAPDYPYRKHYEILLSSLPAEEKIKQLAEVSIELASSEHNVAEAVCIQRIKIALTGDDLNLVAIQEQVHSDTYESSRETENSFLGNSAPIQEMLRVIEDEEGIDTSITIQELFLDAGFLDSSLVGRSQRVEQVLNLLMLSGLAGDAEKMNFAINFLSKQNSLLKSEALRDISKIRVPELVALYRKCSEAVLRVHPENEQALSIKESTDATLAITDGEHSNAKAKMENSDAA